MLGLSTSAFANRKRANSIPYDALIPLADSLNLSLDALIFGEPREGGPTQAGSRVTQVDATLLIRVLVELRRATNPDESPGDRAKFGVLAGIAAGLYNDVAALESEQAQTVFILKEAKSYASALKLMDFGERVAADRLALLGLPDTSEGGKKR